MAIVSGAIALKLGGVAAAAATVYGSIQWYDAAQDTGNGEPKYRDDKNSDYIHIRDNMEKTGIFKEIDENYNEEKLTEYTNFMNERAKDTVDNMNINKTQTTEAIRAAKAAIQAADAANNAAKEAKQVAEEANKTAEEANNAADEAMYKANEAEVKAKDAEDKANKAKKDDPYAFFFDKNNTTREKEQQAILLYNMERVNEILSGKAEKSKEFLKKINDLSNSNKSGEQIAREIYSCAGSNEDKTYPKEAWLAAAELGLWKKGINLRALIDGRGKGEADNYTDGWERSGYNKAIYKQYDQGALYDPRVGAIAMMNAMEGQGTYETVVNKIAYSESSNSQYRYTVTEIFDDKFMEGMEEYIKGDYSGSDEAEMIKRFIPDDKSNINQFKSENRGIFEVPDLPESSDLP